MKSRKTRSGNAPARCEADLLRYLPLALVPLEDEHPHPCGRKLGDGEVEDDCDERWPKGLADKIGAHALTDIECALLFLNPRNAGLVAETAVAHELRFLRDRPEAACSSHYLADIVSRIPAGIPDAMAFASDPR